MITKETFCTIIDEADKYFNGNINKAFELLQINENIISDAMDTIIGAIDDEIDPKHKAIDDDYCWDCGSFIWEWICGIDEGKDSFRNKCPTAGDLYDYIIKAYENN